MVRLQGSRMKKMRDLEINPIKGRKKGKAVGIDLMPVVTTLPFFSSFFAPSPKHRMYVLYQ